MNFEAVYRSSLPRDPVLAAQQRLEHLRNLLVGAKVESPIHFEPGTVIMGGPAAAYARFMPSHADANTAATERSADR